MRNSLGVTHVYRRRVWCSFGRRAAPAILFVIFFPPRLLAQCQPEINESCAPADLPPSFLDFPSQSPQPSAPQSPTDARPDAQDPDPSSPAINPVQSSTSDEGQQTKRILGIVPNFQAVSANKVLPPLSVWGKFWLATEGSFDYSSFISVGIQAAIEQATNTYPEFHQGSAAYGRYYWHTFADSAVENYLTGAIVPAITHEDPRYYTLYHGSFFRRTAYALSRLWITKKDSGARTFNFSELIGSGVSAEVSGRYYPRQERGVGETFERWMSSVVNDGIGNVFQEFWPDIHQRLFHRH